MLKELEKLSDYLSCSLKLGASPQAAISIFWHLMKNVRVRLGLSKYAPDKIYSIETIYGPLHFRDNFGDITNLVTLLYHQTYRWKNLKQSGAILDIGANIGLAAVWFGIHNPDHPIYCFEPLHSNIELIRRNWPKAKLYSIALAASEGEAQLNVDRNGVMASWIKCRWDTVKTGFKTVPLDAVVEKEGISQVALMKIDAEGMEIEIMRGAQKTLERTAAVVLETHSRMLHQQSIELLTANGFSIDVAEFYETTGMLFAVK